VNRLTGFGERRTGGDSQTRHRNDGQHQNSS